MTKNERMVNATMLYVLHMLSNPKTVGNYYEKIIILRKKITNLVIFSPNSDFFAKKSLNEKSLNYGFFLTVIKVKSD